LNIVSPAYVVTACFFVVAVVALVVGSFMVRVPVILDGQGMLMSDTEVVSYAIMPESEGRLEEFLVKSGSAVKKGQVIARVSIPRLENEIEAGKLALHDLRLKEDRLNTFHKESMDAAKVTIQQQRVEAQNRDLSLRERLARLDKARAGDSELIKMGFLSARAGDAVNTERGQVF
jgi:multidrug efflux pump subunit AcrA (membrane-fusion protein)